MVGGLVDRVGACGSGTRSHLRTGPLVDHEQMSLYLGRYRLRTPECLAQHLLDLGTDIDLYSETHELSEAPHNSTNY